MVETLAQALDRDDYQMAASVLADRVEYTVGDEAIVGPDAVVASYRAASEMAHRLFDEVGYHHEVLVTDDPITFRVGYTDVLTVAGETLVHSAEQVVTATPDDGVIRIVNVDLPGERERVDEFLTRHGLSRDQAS
jgi:hypothetical protein